jgi:hypothetical protein
MIPMDEKKKTDLWNAFENAATYSHARSIFKENKTKQVSTSENSYSKKTMETVE